jgi:hypothetical protein
VSGIPVFRRLGQEDLKFDASLGYIASSRPACATQRDHVSKSPRKRERVAQVMNMACFSISLGFKFTSAIYFSFQ